MMQAEPSQLSPSPSFSSYSSETLAQIAARVIQEFRTDPCSISDDPLFDSWQTGHFHHADHRDHGGDDDDDFEFAFVCRDPDSSSVSADDIFYNGQIRPMYPILDRNLLFTGASFAPTSDGVSSVSSTLNAKETAPVRRHRPPLRKLMFEERETGSCSSSTSEADDNDLERVTPGTYCVWNPKPAAADSLGRPCKKSTSTGSSSKRWKLRDLLVRSHSNGKEPFLFLTPSKRSNKVAHEASKPNEKLGSGDNSATGSVERESRHYMRNRGMGTAKEGDQTKRKSFLPERQEVVGLFSNVNGLGRNLHPF